VIGNDARSFGYGGTAKKSTSGRYEDYGDKYQGKVGTVVSCLIYRSDPEHQTISYGLDGRNLGVAFRLAPELSGAPLFPAICGKGVWSATCRWTDFKFLEEGYRPLSQALAAREAVAAECPNAADAPKGVPVVPTLADPKAAILTNRLRGVNLQAE
jgi:hypothetical protein